MATVTNLEGKLNEILILLNEALAGVDDTLTLSSSLVEEARHGLQMLAYEIADREARILKIAECLIEPHSDDAMEEAKHILDRVEGRRG